MLLRLTAAGLSWGEARSICLEEVLCLLVHLELEDALSALRRESDRVASLALADEGQQHKRLAGLELRARGLINRFYRTEHEE